MYNDIKSRIFALRTNPKWMLSASEEPEVMDKLPLALNDYASIVRKVFGKDDVDWVVM